MECAKCGEQTVDAPCRSCGEDPLLDGRYRLLNPAGKGASGSTWRARNESTGEVVAIKEMLLSKSDTAKTRELWEREVQVLKQLSHPQIPKFVDRFIVGRGRSRSLCLVQEFIEGVSLEEEMKSKRYTEADAVQIARDLLPVLEYLHGLSPPVIHRDLKPSNVMRRPSGELVLIDFGSVRDALKDATLGGSTVAGTFGYMAPEQFRGDASPATDYYGLGGLIVTLLTRKAPHTLLNSRGQLLWKEHCDVGASTATLIDGLLSVEPEKRPVGAGSFEELLQVGHAEVERTDASTLFEPTQAAQLPGNVADNPLVVPAPEGQSPGKSFFLVYAVGLLGILLLVGLSVLNVPGADAPPSSPPVVQPPSVPIVTPLKPPKPAVPSPQDSGLAKAVGGHPEPSKPVLPIPRDTGLVKTMDGDSYGGYLWNPDRPSDGHYSIGPEPSTLLSVDELVGVPFREGLTVRYGGHEVPIQQGRLYRCGDTGCAKMTWAAPSKPIHTVVAATPYGAQGVEVRLCMVSLRIGTDGRVMNASAGTCPSPFRLTAVLAGREWLYAAADEPSFDIVEVLFTPSGLQRRVTLTSGPSNASLWIDGDKAGRLPWSGDLPLGRHIVKIGRRAPVSVKVAKGKGGQLIRL